MQYGKVRGEEAQLLLQTLGALAVGGQQQGETLGRAGGFGDGEAQRGAWQIAPGLLAGGGGQLGNTQYGHGRSWLRSGNLAGRIVTIRIDCCQSSDYCRLPPLLRAVIM
ncbi:hypothetical protein D3C81_1351670 [compost metagenome]